MHIFALLKAAAGIKDCPTAGRGVHQFLIYVALKLVNRIEPDRLYEFMEYATAGCGRDVPDDEILGVIEWASHASPISRVDSQGSSFASEKARLTVKADLDEGLIADICSRNLAYLGELPPPIGLDEYPADLASKVFQALFARYSPDPLIAFANEIKRFRAKNLSDAELMFLHRAQFILPNPLISTAGKTADELRMSPRSTSNVAGWFNFVVEFDATPLQDQLKLIEFLADHAPLLLVVFSENKSFHSWFDVSTFSDSERIEFQRLACSLGADPALCRLSQPTRVPLGIRVSECGIYANSRHRILHFQPKQG